MSKRIVRFSRLLRIFEINKNPAFIIELEENNQKNLYISYNIKKNAGLFHKFELYSTTDLKKEFKNLSNHCLMNQCTNAYKMFQYSPITHFEADCSSLFFGDYMFYYSRLRSINAEFPALEYARYMFSYTKIKEITINFPKLKNGNHMFYKSSIETITSEFPMLENGEWMFEATPLKEINCKFLNLKHKKEMFTRTPPELKLNYPHYFV